jgi:hypothetical protein
MLYALPNYPSLIRSSEDCLVKIAGYEALIMYLFHSPVPSVILGLKFTSAICSQTPLIVYFSGLQPGESEIPDVRKDIFR